VSEQHPGDRMLHRRLRDETLEVDRAHSPLIDTSLKCVSVVLQHP
jgi:hypothetical protein